MTEKERENLVNMLIELIQSEKKDVQFLKWLLDAPDKEPYVYKFALQRLELTTKTILEVYHRIQNDA